MILRGRSDGRPSAPPVVLVLLVAGAAALALTAAAGANKPRIDKTDQAAAQHAVLRRSDLPSTVKWKGGATRPSGDSSSSFTCQGYDPKDSDLVTTADAESRFSAPGVTIDSEVARLQTARMVDLDWQRSIVPAIIPCLGHAFDHGANGGLSILSTRRVPFPKLAAHAVDYRILFEAASAGKKIRGVIDLILFGSDRTEVTLTVLAVLGPPSSVASGEAFVTAFERGLASVLARRALGHRTSPLTA